MNDALVIIGSSFCAFLHREFDFPCHREQKGFGISYCIISRCERLASIAPEDPANPALKNSQDVWLAINSLLGIICVAAILGGAIEEFERKLLSSKPFLIGLKLVYANQF